ncbi:MAG: SRPBCC family protein [Candidatus Rokubacteria bacterium]|nr:SRPBCC family protein [Candidatus Rokubacteria bacterium]
MIIRPIRTLHRGQWVPRSLHEVFDFFERPENLPRITPPWLGFRILTPPPLTMRCGLVIDYTVRVLGMPTHWRSQIAEYDAPHGFRDVQVIGPYRLWDHRHRFRRENGGTLIEDFVVYEPPLGRLGAVLDALVIRRQLAAIFEYRRQRIEEFLGASVPVNAR